MNRIIRRALMGWQAWREKRRLFRAIPDLAEIDRQREAYRKAHKRGVSTLDRRAQSIMHAALRGRG